MIIFSSLFVHSKQSFPSFLKSQISLPLGNPFTPEKDAHHVNINITDRGSSLLGVKHRHQSGAFGRCSRIHGLAVVREYRQPFLPRIQGLRLLVDEVAAIAKAAVALLREGVASLGLVGSIVLHVNPQVLRPVGELALAAVGTAPPLHEIFAQ